MPNEDHEWPAGRIAHLLGGYRAINSPGPTVDLSPNSLNGEQAKIQLKEFSSMYSSLEKLGLQIVGVDFFVHIHELEGIRPPEWRSYHRFTQTLWPCAETYQTWRNIGHAAFQKKQGFLWDLASRIAYQLHACSWRLREISESYSNQLQARVKGNKFRPGKFFEDGYTRLLYLSLQSFLIDACILRDYLAEFAAGFVFIPRYSLTISKKVTTMAGLKKHIIKHVPDTDTLRNSLERETSERGWIHVLGSYRDLIIHSAPLANAESKLFAIGDTVTTGGRSLPIIICPIPDDPVKIMNSRSKGDLFKDFEAQVESFLQSAKGSVPKADGMRYAHCALGQLSELAHELAILSPLQPKIMEFNSTNIIGPIKVIES